MATRKSKGEAASQENPPKKTARSTGETQSKPASKAAGAAKAPARKGGAAAEGTAPAEKKAPAAKAGATGEGAAAKGKRAAPKADAATTAGAKKKAPAAKAAGSRANTGDARLRGELRDFASARPQGWGHDDWLSFLDHLREKGHDTSNSEEIGQQLERERLAASLERVPGLGPRKVDALVSRFGTLWSLRHASVDEIAALPGIPRALAERVRTALG